MNIWDDFINSKKIAAFAEIGVWRGEFAETILRRCQSIERYYMLDLWRHFKEWNKPANVSNVEFDYIYDETNRIRCGQTHRAARQVLQGS